MNNDVNATYRLSFRVFHPQLKANEISTELKCNPRYSWNVGERAVNKRNEEFGIIKKDTYCSYDIDYSSEIVDIKTEIAHFLNEMECHRDFLLYLSKTGGKLKLHLAWFVSNHMSGEIFTSSLLEKISNFKIDFEIEIYPDMPISIE